MEAIASLQALERALAAALPGPLPGAEAQARMAPVPRPGWTPEHPSPPGIPAAVLVLFYPAVDRLQSAVPVPHVLLTERTGAVEKHKHQIAYPGGSLEPDETPIAAALREAHEETGVSPSLPRVLGALTPLYVPATGFTIQPFVATVARRPALRRQPSEVARLLEVPLARLLEPECLRFAATSTDGLWREVPYFDLGGQRLWGASAMITAEWLALLGWERPD